MKIFLLFPSFFYCDGGPLCSHLCYFWAARFRNEDGKEMGIDLKILVTHNGTQSSMKFFLSHLLPMLCCFFAFATLHLLMCFDFGDIVLYDGHMAVIMQTCDDHHPRIFMGICFKMIFHQEIDDIDIENVYKKFT